MALAIPILKRLIPSTRILEITLNRPKVLNSLSTEMCSSLIDILQKDINKPTTENDENEIRAFIVKGNGGKAFCAGGDVKSLWYEVQSMKKDGNPDLGSGKPGSLHADFFRTEYTMNYLLHSSNKPQISLWDGVVMGGGVGVSVLGEFRVATEKSLFAMPETAIGLIPDVASTAWLPHLPNGYGLYIGLTSSRLQAADLMHTKIATHYISSARLPELEKALSSVDIPRDFEESRNKIREVLDVFEEKPDLSSAIVIPHSDIINRCFGSTVGSVEEVVASLQKELSSPSRSQREITFIQETLNAMSKMSPLSLKLFFSQFRRGRKLDLKACLQLEFRVILRCMRDGDFVEGVRALLVDKDQRPQWLSQSLETITEEQIEPFFAPLGDHELLLEGDEESTKQ